MFHVEQKQENPLKINLVGFIFKNNSRLLLFNVLSFVTLSF